jgi:alpha(1,3/1,4) fucosyltransferase
MKTIKIKYVDFWSNFDPENNFITDILKKHFVVELSDKPEYLICSCFGYDYLKYDCVRIQFIFENITPNFSTYDYIIGFDWIEYEDRYLRFPLYGVSNYAKMFEKAQKKHIDVEEAYSKRKFCNFVVSNADNKQNCREEFYDLLSKYKIVDSGGRHRNNIGGPVADKYEFQREYKFSIAFENTESNGYTTEKLIEAWAAGTIPIYWGNPIVSKDFNRNALVNCHEFDNLEDIVKEVQRIDSDDELYMSILRQPILLNDSVANQYKTYELLERFFCSIFEQDKHEAYRRNKRRVGFENNEKALLLFYRMKICPRKFLRNFISKRVVNYLKQIFRVGKIG